MALLDSIAPHAHKPLLIAALALPTTRAQRVSILLLIAAAEWHHYTLMLNEPRYKGFSDYFMASSISSPLLASLDWLLMTEDPRASVRPIPTHRTHVGSSASPNSLLTSAGGASKQPAVSSLQRLWFATALTFSPRAIGTTAQISNIPPLSPELKASRAQFCIWRLVYGLGAALRLGASYFLIMHFETVQEAIFTERPDVVCRMLNTVLSIHAVYCIVNGGHCVVSAVAVASGFSEPEQWPDQFGAFSEAYTLRKAWGRSWHQNFRKPFTSIGAWVAQSVFHVQPHSIASRYIKLFTAFALSGWVHNVGDYVMYTNALPHTNTSLLSKFTWDACFSPQFFLAQAVGITFEDALIAFIKNGWGTPARKRVSSKKVDDGREVSHMEIELPVWVAQVGRIVGYLWVFAFLCATLPALSRGILKWEFDPALRAQYVQSTLQIRE